MTIFSLSSQTCSSTKRVRDRHPWLHPRIAASALPFQDLHASQKKYRKQDNFQVPTPCSHVALVQKSNQFSKLERVQMDWSNNPQIGREGHIRWNDTFVQIVVALNLSNDGRGTILKIVSSFIATLTHHSKPSALILTGPIVLILCLE